MNRNHNWPRMAQFVVAFGLLLIGSGLLARPAGAMPPALPCDSGEGVYLYQHTYYYGRCAKFTADSPAAHTWSIGNDTASSIRIVGNWIGTICQHPNYQGTCTSFRVSSPDFNILSDGQGGSMNDQASSIRVYRANGGGGGGGGGSGGSGGGTPSGCIRNPQDVNETRQWCWCVDWIVRRYDLCRFSGYGNAESLDQPHGNGVWMERNGFRRVDTPRSGDVVVIQSWVTNVAGGHIGYINSDPWWDQGDMKVAMVSANWPGQDERTENGCTNVWTAQLRVHSDRRSGYSFWRR